MSDSCEAVRPRPKAALPIRASVVPHGRFGECVVLEYEGEVTGPDGVKRLLPYRAEADLKDASGTAVSVLKLRVFEMMRTFREVEAERDGLERDRDEARSEAAELRGKLLSATKKIEELQRRK